MLCNSCGIQIPEKWVAAIKRNECPQCSGSIMNEKSKQLLDELSNGLKEVTENAEGVANWLLSNYKIEKIKDEAPEIPEFHSSKKRKKQFENTSVDDEIENNDFMKRANVKPERLKEIAKILNSAQDNLYGADESNEVEEEIQPSEEDIQMAKMIRQAQPKTSKTTTGSVNANTQDTVESMVEESDQNLDRLQRLVEQEKRRRPTVTCNAEPKVRRAE